MQKLILPINNCRVNAGYKTAYYRKRFGFPHYGVDLISTKGDAAVYACGDGTVIAAGMDGNTSKEKGGNCIVIVYKDVVLPDGRQLSLACRMFHFAKVSVKAGDKVTKNTVIGWYGNTGAYTTGAHLHIEFDTDVQWPAHAYGIAAGGKVIKKGTIDSTINPSVVWFCSGKQSITTPPDYIQSGCCAQMDINIPALG